MSATGRSFRTARGRWRAVAAVAALALITLVALVAPAPPADASTTPVAAGATGGTSAMEGQVLSQMDPVVGDVTVTAFNADTGAAVKSVVSDGSGNWFIGGLAAGRYKVRAAKPGYLTSWANGKTTKATADVFTLYPGQTLTQSWDPLALYLDLIPEAVLQGSVLGINDNPSAAFDDPLPGVTVTAFDADTGAAVRSTTTDAFGNFRLTGLGPNPAGGTGRYKVRAAKAGWITTWADGKSSKATADVFATFPGQVLDVPGLTLFAPASMQGQVLSQMDPVIGDVTVTAFDADTGAAVRTVVSDGSGNWFIGGLAPGRFKVRATKAGYLTWWANFGTSKATADVFTLYAGQTLTQSWDPITLYLDLIPEAVIQGSVLGISEYTDDPVPGIKVTAFNADTGVAVKSATTDALGNYRIDGLHLGRYKARAAGPGWITSWATGRSTKATADVFFVNPGDVTDVSFTLYAPAAMQGQVLGWMDPLGGARVTAFDAGSGSPVKSVVADGDGNWRIDGLPPGNYKVRATKDGWVASWANGATTKATATVVTLQPGQTLTQSWDPNVLYLDLSPVNAPVS